MKLPILLASLAVFAASAHADTHKPKAKKPNCGESFDLSHRHGSTPTGDTETVAKARALTDAQVAGVVTKRLADIEYCWNKLPAARRIESTAVLELAIAAAGSVVTAEIGGDVPAGATKCMAAAAARWTFPVADLDSQIEYAVALRTK